MTLPIVTKLNAALLTKEPRALIEAASLARAYLRRNPPWKSRTLLWFCVDCATAAAPLGSRTGRPWPAGRPASVCDLCGADEVELEGVVTNLE